MVGCSFTSAGSFYLWDERVVHLPMSAGPHHQLVGRRACIDAETHAQVAGIDYLSVLTEKHAWAAFEKVNYGHPLLESKNITWLLLGDSTDREAIRAWCVALKNRARLPNPRGHVEHWSAATQHPTSRDTDYVGCSISGSRGMRSGAFSLAHFQLFGVLNTSSMVSESVKVAQLSTLTQCDTLEAPARIEELSRAQVCI